MIEGPKAFDTAERAEISPAGDPLERREILISRLVDGEGSQKDWDEFARLADGLGGENGAAAWRDLAVAQRAQMQLAAAVEEVAARAERVELADWAARGASIHPGAHRAGRLRAVAIGGWATAAAALVIMGVIAEIRGPRMPVSMNGERFAGRETTPEHTAGPTITAEPSEGFVRLASHQQALQDYIELGQQAGDVVGELPGHVLVESRPLSTGDGYEVLYIRQILERATVSDLYRFGRDDGGRPVLTPAAVQGPPIGPAL